MNRAEDIWRRQSIPQTEWYRCLSHPEESVHQIEQLIPTSNRVLLRKEYWEYQNMGEEYEPIPEYPRVIPAITEILETDENAFISKQKKCTSLFSNVTYFRHTQTKTKYEPLQESLIMKTILQSL